MDRIITYHITEQDAGLRIEQYLRRRGYSRQNLVELKKMPESILVNGVWYYLNPDGSMAAGWLQWQGNWYYLDPSSGQMVRDKAVDQHYVNQAGIWVP